MKKPKSERIEIMCVSKAEQESIKLAKGLVQIAYLVMPDTYFATDSRVRRAKRVLKKYGVDVQMMLEDMD